MRVRTPWIFGIEKHCRGNEIGWVGQLTLFIAILRVAILLKALFLVNKRENPILILENGTIPRQSATNNKCCNMFPGSFITAIIEVGNEAPRWPSWLSSMIEYFRCTQGIAATIKAKQILPGIGEVGIIQSS